MPVVDLSYQAATDYFAARLAAGLPAVVDGSGGTLPAIVSTEEDKWDEFVRMKSKNDGAILCWLGKRTSPDKPVAISKQMEKSVMWRLRIAYPYAAPEEAAASVGAVAGPGADVFKNALRQKAYDVVADNLTMGGNLLDCWVRDEQEATPFKPPLRGFELTVGGLLWYHS